MDHGDVLTYVIRNPDVNRKYLVRRIAEGVQVLHTYEPPIAHGDLKAVSPRTTCIYLSCKLIQTRHSGEHPSKRKGQSRHRRLWSLEDDGRPHGAALYAKQRGIGVLPVVRT